MKYTGPFKGYYNTPEWKDKAREARRHYGQKCKVCGFDYRARGEHLAVHHTNYDRWGGDERMSDLTCLCFSHHPRGKFPKDFIEMARKSYRWRKRLASLYCLVRSVLGMLWKKIARSMSTKESR